MVIIVPQYNHTLLFGIYNSHFSGNVVGIKGLDSAELQRVATQPMIPTSTPLEIGHRGCGVTDTDRELFDQ